MAKMGDRKAPYESGEAEKSSIRGPSGQFKSLEVEDTRASDMSEAQHLIALVHSRTNEESPSPSTTSDSLKKHKHGIASHSELPKHPATMMNLPDELLSKILIRLLAKQLAQMRSVSKSWNTFLSRPSFIKSHLHHSIHTNDQFLLFFFHHVSPLDSKQFATRSCQSPHLALTNFIKLPPFTPGSYTITVIGSVNGLICSRYGHMWNPSLSAVLTLPPYSVPSGGYHLTEISLRFGFDPKTDDYKVFKLVKLLTCDDNWSVELYSMRKGSWDFVTTRFPSHIKLISDDDLVCLDGHDGHIHWLGYTNKKDDLERIMPLPHSTVVCEHGRWNALGVLAGKLCVVSRVWDGTSEVWVMDEYGVYESWVKRHVFSQFTRDSYPFGFTSQSEFVLGDHGRLSLYDSAVNKTKVFDNYCDGQEGAAKIVEYVDSLVWLVPAKREMVVYVEYPFLMHCIYTLSCCAMEHEDVMEDASVTANDHVDVYVDVEVNDEDSDDSIEEIDPDSQGVESTSTKKRKTRTLKSEVWQWFTIIKKKPNDTGPQLCVCNKCGQKYKAGSDQGTEINEEPQNVSWEAGQNNSTGVLKLSTHKGGDIASISATIGMSELEQILKHKAFTRSEIQRLIELLHSRNSEESPRIEASTTSGNFNAAIVRSKVSDVFMLISSVPLVELTKAYYKGSTIGTGQAPRQDLKLINNNATCLSKTPTTSSQDPASIKYLPNEILTNIFVRLLAKQLAQMRSVSKSWNALLSHSSFIKSHIHHSTHNKDQVLLVFYSTSSSSSDYKQFTALPCRSPHLELTNFIKLPVNPQSRFNGIRIIGSVNGLICSSYGPNSVIHIWNPSLSSVLTLPPYSTPSDGCLQTHFRFGYDPETNDYKVVILPSLIRPHTYAGKWWLQIEIYSMRKGSWKWIIQEVPSYITCVTDVDKTCVDGHDSRIHWLGYTKKDDLLAFERIVAFDLGSEQGRNTNLNPRGATT
ncbi:hypothetical protein LXL04_002255 [Taraxacum kok-saghyz]